MRKSFTYSAVRIVAFLLVFMFNTFELGAQVVKFNFQKMSLKSALVEIEKKTDIKFVYSSALEGINQPVTMQLELKYPESIDSFLESLLKDKNIAWKRQNNSIVLFNGNKKPEEKINDEKITGVITEENGEPLIGVTVKNLTTGNFTITDFKGKYSVQAKEGEKLSFSFIGMETVYITVDKSASVNVIMKTDLISLEEVVVTGYQTISKERATGSYNIIKNVQLQKPSTSIAQRLIGTTAGMQSKTDIDGNISFEIRGQTSLLANGQPLLVIDGFPTQGSFNSINPNDVESITILKDAAAASIWGAKSANGVIVIVTKNGSGIKSGDVRIEYQSFIKYSPKIDWDYANPLASSSETVEYEKTFFQNNGFTRNTNSFNGNTATSLAVTALNENYLGYLSNQELSDRLSYLSGLNNTSQIKKYMLDNPFVQQHNFSVMTSSEKATSAISLLYEQQNKYLNGDSQNKYNFSASSNVKIYKWLEFNIKGNFVVNDIKNNAISYSQIAQLSPYQLLVNEDGSRNTEMTGYSNGSFGTMSGLYTPNLKRYVNYTAFPYSDWSYNPITEREGRDYRTQQTIIKGQAGFRFKIIEGLSFETKGQYERIEEYTKNINDETTALVRNFINQTSTYNQTTKIVKPNLPKGSIMEQNKSNVFSYNWRNQVNFNRSIKNEKHQLNFILGTELSSNVLESTKYGRTYGYNDQKLTVGTYLNGLGGTGNYKLTDFKGNDLKFSDYTNVFTEQTERYFSAYANFSYTLLKKYTLSMSARADASNLITDNPTYRYSPFWSIGASWIISDENYMQNLIWLDRLTLRTTYGYNGNVDRSTSFLPLINIGSTLNSNLQAYTATISSYGNPTLRWEKTRTIDLGFDYSLFKGKLFGKLDFYNKAGKDLIVSMSIPSTNGATTQKLNAAEMINNGFEFEIGTQLRVNNNIWWSGNLNLAYNKNTISKLFKVSYTAEEMTKGGPGSYVEDYNANTVWTYKYNGVKNFGTESNPVFRPTIIDHNGNVYSFNTSTVCDGRKILQNSGTSVAPFTLGFMNTFKIYNLDISLTITGKFGHKFRGYSFNYPYLNRGSARPNNLYSEVLKSDPTKIAPIPVDGEPSYVNWYVYYPYLDYSVQNASHLRFQEFNLTYNLPSLIIKSLTVTKASIYAQANNLFVITNNKYNEDPEFPIGSLKPSPTYTLGIKITF